MNNISLSFQSSYLIFYIVLALAALGISWWSYRDLVPLVSRLKRAALLAMRTVAIFLIGVLLLEPLLTRFTTETIGDKLGVIFDLSSSMQTVDAKSSRAKQALESYATLDGFGHPTQYYGFSDTVMALNKAPRQNQFDGRATNLAEAISQPEKLAGDDLGALLIITDGAGNIGADPLAIAAASPVPVYSLVVGQNRDYKDVAITNIDYPPVSYINTEFDINVEISASGYNSIPTMVEIQNGSRVIASKKIALPGDGAYEQVDFKLNFAEEGVKNLRVVVSALEGETHTENNIRHFSIKLLKDKLNILILASNLNWDLTFLKRALKADKHFRVRTAVANNNNTIPISDIPASLDTWKEIDLIIAMDVNTRALGSQINNLEAAVEAGSGFLFIAGNTTRLSPLGGWEDILPAKPTRRSSLEDGEFFPQPGLRPLAKSVTSIDDLDWSKLSPIKYLIDNLDVSPNAIVFLTAAGTSNNSNPVLIGNKYKNGKTAAMLAYPWWPRSFRPEESSRLIEAVGKFWGNLVRWLVAREDMDKFNLISDKTVYKLGEPVSFNAVLFDDSYNLISGARINIEIQDSAGTKREFQLTGDQPGRYSGVLGAPASGKYTYDGYAIVDSDTVGKAHGEYLIEAFGLEMENLSANYTLMRQISSLTGGRSYNIDDFANFKSDLKFKTKTSESFNEYQATGNLYVLIFIILLLAGEWGIRKFNQLA